MVEPAVVGIVVVCHSRPLARASVALAQEMRHGRQVRMTIAAGLDENTFGTDAGEILEAITAADQGSGVVVLMDLGSALLSAELALDLLDDDVRGRVVLCPAPLVEGLVVAAVAAAGGASRHEVAAEAAGALAGKTSHLASPGSLDGAPESAGTTGGELHGTFTVANPHGLHARPASRMVQQARTFDARIQLCNRTTRSAWVPASSLSKVATLGARRGHDVEIRVSGRQAREALDHLLALASRRFDETTGPDDDPATKSGGRDAADGVVSPRRSPIPASPGIGIGPARPTSSVPVDVPDSRCDNPAEEWRRLRKAVAAIRREVQRVRVHAARELGESQAAIFDAHLLLLDDADMHEQVHARIDSGQAAAPAWSAVITEVAEQLAAIADPYLQARAADMAAVGKQVLRALLGAAGSANGKAGVLVAADLTPADAAGLDPTLVSAVLLAFGSATAHSAILLRARGIPAVVAAGPTVLDISDGTWLAVDGTRGEFVVDPSIDVAQTFATRAADLDRRERHARQRAVSAAATTDDVHLLVGANVGSVEDARLAVALGADLAGLVRTEFLFLGRAEAPRVEEQEAVYRDIARAFGGRRITLRTLDVGGDKPLSYLPTHPEANSFLGVRGIRLSLTHPRLLTEQLLAMVRVAHDAPVSLMFPMVSTLDELLRAQRFLDDAIRQTGRGRPDGLQVGIMVEVPATALKTAVFAPHVDFLSIGTNDLTQYALAAERGNDAVAEVGDPFDPGVLRLVDAVCRGAAGRALVAVCGELATDERAAGLLVGLGVRELSVALPAVPTIKQAVRAVDSRAAAALAADALDAHSAEVVRELCTPPSGEQRAVHRDEKVPLGRQLRP